MELIDVVGIDPGKTTGYVVVRGGQVVQTGSVSFERLIEYIAFERGVLEDWLGVHDWAVEDYKVYPWVKQRFSPVNAARVIGMVLVAARRGGAHVELQMARPVKQYATDELLREIGWWSCLRGAHARDAARHALYYLHKQETNNAHV